MNSKKQILSAQLDPDVFERKMNEREELRKEIEKQYTDVIKKTNEEKNKLLDDIKNVSFTSSLLLTYYSHIKGIQI